ncbi:MBL fold metallo-hydrolase [Solicola sp. PLA-1-18]|uniref:MBL fold metallo-hydrolase n=1 Tax=Solicola sp. PLA-1-18 TaxID=3380532 RepID=UPI003B7CE721
MSDLAVTWWGHATCTVELDGARVLTDPLLLDRLAHLRRFAPTPPDEARTADVVLVSHLHPDHLHVPSLRLVADGAVFVVPRGAAGYLQAAGVPSERVLEVVPGDRVDVAGVDVEVLPAAHDGHRHVLSRVTAPALGFRLAHGRRTLWFPGDTGLTDDMRDVDPVDLALAPVGGWGPTLPVTHLGPAEAAVAVGRVGATHAVPVHYGTFWPRGMTRLQRHRRLFTEPGTRFAHQLTHRSPSTRPWVPGHGERLVLPAVTP